MRRNIPRLRAAIHDDLLPCLVKASEDYAAAGIPEMEQAILKQAAMYAIAHDRLIGVEQEAMRANIDTAVLGAYRWPSSNAATITYMVDMLEYHRAKMMLVYNGLPSHAVSRNLMLAHAVLRRLPLTTPIEP